MIRPSRFLAVAAVSAAVVAAQGFGGRASGTPGTPPDPTTMIQMRVSYLATLLSLTDAQKTQATTIFTNAYTASQTVMTSLQTNHQSLASAVKTNNSASIDQIAATMGTLEGQLTAINAKADAAFYAILTADQQAKYDSLPHGGRGFPGAGPGFHGGRPH